MPTLRYADALFEIFPHFNAWLFDAYAMNGPSCEELQMDLRAEQQTARERIGRTQLSEIPSIKAWHEAFRQLGLDPVLYPTSAEALLRRVMRNEEIPSANNTLIDIGHLMSIRYALPITFFDMNRVANQSLTVRFASGDERFIARGGRMHVSPQFDEVIFTDRANTCHARRWCWQHSAVSAPQYGPQDFIALFEAHHPIEKNTAWQMVKDLMFMVMRYGGRGVVGMGGHIHAGEREHRL
jgi:DNA/RNA-binding domain of Phe-tRNA-synthetase-like protein